MFRIKNVRNSTVAKQTNIPNQNHHPLPLRPNPPQQPIKPPKVNNNNLKSTPRIQLNRKNEKTKLIIPQAQRQIVGNGILIKKNNEIKQRKFIQPKGNQIENKMEIIEKQIETAKSKEIIRDAEPIAQIEISLQNKIIQSQQPKNTQIKQIFQIKQQKQKTQIEVKQQLQKKRQAEVKEQLQKRKEEKRQKQEQQQRQNQAKLKEMMQKVNARRRARQQQKQNRLRLQMQRQNQSVGGIMALSDPLAHVQMSEAVMDIQVNHILTMKFANYPNKQAIERQVEELERINRSYLLVRVDPTNSLNRGLSNFRIELFNRVGQLIMQAQASLGPSASGLQVIQSDSKNYPQIKGMHVTRGLQGHLSMLKKTVLKSIQECSICLCQIQKGLSIYDVQCGHKFHQKCLQDWLNTNANCPACRYNIKYNHY